MFRKMRVSWIAMLILVVFQTAVFAAAASNEPSTGYSPNPAPPSITLTAPIGGESWERVGNTFAIVAGANELPTIRLTSPNGGEVWNKGFTYKITWAYTGNPSEPVKIMLVPKNDLAGFIMISDGVSVGSGGYGSYSWKIPFAVPRGADYTVWIGNGAVHKNFIDMSDNTFVINELVK